MWIALALLIIVVDQFTKVLVMHEFQLGDSRAVTAWFNLVRVHNAGAAFSFLAGASGWQRWFFIGLGLVASVFIIWLLRRHPGQTLFCLAVSLILGGAIGNVIDRAWHGHVVDFLQFRFDFLEPVFRGGYFPSFNVADAAITGGAIGLIADEIRRVRRS
ncbi:MAG: signal peptidase II [Aquabacterium sp.]